MGQLLLCGDLDTVVCFLAFGFGLLHLTLDLIIRPVGENWRPVCGRWPSKASHRLCMCTRQLPFMIMGSQAQIMSTRSHWELAVVTNPG